MGKRKAGIGDFKQKPVEKQAHGIPKRVIIAGYGEVGQSIARGLYEADISYFVIDDDPERISEAKSSRHPRIYGDATNINVLSKADLEHANALVVAYPDPMAVLTTVKLAQHLNPDLLILARASRKNDKERLRQLGVEELVIPEREAGYKFVKILLKAIGLEQEERKHLLAIARKTIFK